ncbi:unnamed protein product, partial [Didymodactylos carnosus]
MQPNFAWSRRDRGRGGRCP